MMVEMNSRKFEVMAIKNMFVYVYGIISLLEDTYKNNMNRNGTIHYYTCAQKLTHKCQARAIIKRVEDVDDDGR